MCYTGVKDIKEQLRVLNLLVLLLPDVHQAVLKVSIVCVCHVMCTPVYIAIYMSVSLCHVMHTYICVYNCVHISNRV